MRCLRCGLQCWNAENVRAIHRRGPEQFDAFTKIRNEPVAAGNELHDIDHFPIAGLTGVETVTLEAAIGLLLDAQAHAGSGLF